MTEELDNKLCQKYPKIFADRNGNMMTTAMCWGFDCGDGWYNIIDSLCSNLQWNTDKNNKDYVIKNKILRKLIPQIRNIFYKIPYYHNLNRKIQINPIYYIRKLLLNIIEAWRKKQTYIYIESGRYPQIVATQVKEKFGGLRFYVQGASTQQYAVIDFVGSLSYKVCEKCGSMKDIGSTQGWMKTLCKDCHDPESNWKLLGEDETDI